MMEAEKTREAVTSEAAIDPELLTVKGMVAILFPQKQSTEDRAANTAGAGASSKAGARYASLF